MVELVEPNQSRARIEWRDAIDSVLGCSIPRDPLIHRRSSADEVAKLANEREQARLAKDWKKSDELRDKLVALGWEVRDTKEGQKITKRAGA